MPDSIYIPDLPPGGKNPMVFLPTLWSCGGSQFLKKIIFLNFGYICSFWDVAAKHKPILWEGMI